MTQVADALWPVAVAPREEYRIWLRYADGVEGEVDLSRLAGEGVFAMWNDRRFFERVYISRWRSIAWSNEIELCPDALYKEITGKTPEGIPRGLRGATTASAAGKGGATVPAPEKSTPGLRDTTDDAEVSRFYGIVVRIDFRMHRPPHFHARYAEAEAAIGIRDLTLLEGELQRRARGLVLEWAAEHRDELLKAWNRAQHGEAPGKIAPLD